MGDGLPRVNQGTVAKPGPQVCLLADSLGSCPPVSDRLTCPLPTQRHANWTQGFLSQAGGQTKGMAPLSFPRMRRGGPEGECSLPVVRGCLALQRHPHLPWDPMGQ